MSILAQDLWDSEVDLPSLACHAAIELDNLIRDKSKELVAVIQLIEVISDVGEVLSSSDTAKGSPLAHLNPATAVALNAAIADSKLSTALNNLSDLGRETDQVIQSLRELVENPQRTVEKEPAKADKLKSFCLSLSKRALASEPPLYEAESQHPYRR